jgi:hypothetical protein
MQIAEAMVEVEFEEYRTSEEKQKLYDAVFAKHRITQVKYDSSLIWYGENMDLYMAIYKLVLKDIEKNLAAMSDVKQDPLSGEMSAKDSLDIWIQSDNFMFNSKNRFDRLVFDIKPQQPYISSSSYVLGFNIWGILPSMQNKPRIKLSVVQGDTIISVRQEIQEDGYWETVIKTVETRQVNRIFGYVIMNNAEKFRHIYLDEIKLMKYNKPLQADSVLVEEKLPAQVQ